MKGVFPRYGLLPMVERRMLREILWANRPRNLVDAVLLSRPPAERLELRKKVVQTIQAINVEVGWDYIPCES